MSTEYSIGYVQSRDLRALAEGEQEQEAIARLAEFRGDASDIEVCARIYDRAGEDSNAAELRRIL